MWTSSRDSVVSTSQTPLQKPGFSQGTCRVLLHICFKKISRLCADTKCGTDAAGLFGASWSVGNNYQKSAHAEDRYHFLSVTIPRAWSRVITGLWTVGGGLTVHASLSSFQTLYSPDPTTFSSVTDKKTVLKQVAIPRVACQLLVSGLLWN